MLEEQTEFSSTITEDSYGSGSKKSIMQSFGVHGTLAATITLEQPRHGTQLQMVE